MEENRNMQPEQETPVSWALLPLLAKKLKLDPAVCAAPMITTIVDCCTILIYFALACTVFPGL